MVFGCERVNLSPVQCRTEVGWGSVEECARSVYHSTFDRSAACEKSSALKAPLFYPEDGEAQRAQSQDC